MGLSVAVVVDVDVAAAVVRDGRLCTSRCDWMMRQGVKGWKNQPPFLKNEG